MPSNDDVLWPQDPVEGGRRAARDSGVFPERALDDEPERTRSRGGTATLTRRRAVAFGGLAGVAVLAACEAVPTVRRVRTGAPPPPTPTPATSTAASVTPSAAPTPLPTVTGTVAPAPTGTTAPSATATTAAATTAASATPTPSPTTSAPPPAPTGPATPELVVARGTFGATQALLDEVRGQGPGPWLETQLDPASVPDPGGDAVRAAFAELDRPYSQLTGDVNRGRLVRSLQERALALATWSSRQVYEVVCDFWANHLNVSPRGNDIQDRTRPDYDNSVIRAHAFGRFRDMLAASGMHPCMLEYLNLDGSHRDNPNENYPREILELHTVGVDGGYDQTDVEQLSLLLTGWRVRGRNDGMEPYYQGNRHHVGPVTVMGRTFDNPSEDSGPAMWEELVDFLATHPSTATYLATKLARRFVADEPPESLVQTLAQVYLDNGTEIVPVLRALFTSDEFAASVGAKARRPYERYVATIRLLSAGVPGNVADAADELLDDLPAQDPLGHFPPDGYADDIASWASPGTALGLFNTGVRMLRKQPEEAGLAGADPVVAENPTTFTDVAVATARYLLLRDPSDTEIDAVVAVLGAGTLSEPLANEDAVRRAVEVAGGVLLSSPSHLLR